MIPTRPLLSRRTALATGLGAAGLTALGASGCSVEMPGSGSPTPTPTPRPGGVEPDVQIVVDLVGTLQRSISLLTATIRQHPPLATRLSPLLALEKAHLTELVRAEPDGTPSTDQLSVVDVPRGAPRALARVLRGTVALRGEYRASAGAAESGTFARLLAGMGAALSQRLVVIGPATPAKAAG